MELTGLCGNSLSVVPRAQYSGRDGVGAEQAGDEQEGSEEDQVMGGEDDEGDDDDDSDDEGYEERMKGGEDGESESDDDSEDAQEAQYAAKKQGGSKVLLQSQLNAKISLSFIKILKTITQNYEY